MDSCDGRRIIKEVAEYLGVDSYDLTLALLKLAKSRKDALGQEEHRE